MMRRPSLLFLLLSCTAFSQTANWDTSGNGMLKGTYYFRQVYYFLSSNGGLVDALNERGNITFDGAGSYSMTVALLDAQSGLSQGTTTGKYSIGASGYGFLSNPVTGDVIYGLVNAQGIFVGSETESVQGYNDLFVAAPVGSTPATAATFKGTYSVAFLDLSSGDPTSTVNAMLQISADGVGSLGPVAVSGYIGGYGSTKVTQSLTGVKYAFVNGAGVLNFPTSSTSTALLQGQYYLYISPDGNFVFGGSPYSYDIFVGVRTGTGTPSLSGLYYQAGIDQDESHLASGYATLDTYYGAIQANAGSIVGHQRQLELLQNGAPFDYTYADGYTLKADGTYSNGVMNYVVGAGGVRIGAGIGPYLGISVAIPAAPQTGSGVFLDPTGIVNAASSAPFTARIAPGELLTLYGQNLAASLVVSPSIPFPNTLGKVQVLVNGVAAPLYYVSPTQVSAIVPYAVTSGVAQIQVVNDGAPSNTVTMAVGATAPGVFSVPPGGLGYGAVLHQDGTLVTTSNPAQPGETVSVFATGLGAVNPLVADGAAGPSSTLSQTTGTIAADVSGTTAKVTFAGLAPGLAGLYQVNVTIPTGLTAGDNYLDISGPDSYTQEVLISVAAASSSGTVAAPHPSLWRPRSTTAPKPRR